MKLNYDCLRKILLIIEKELNWDDDLKYKYTNLSSLCDNLKDFSRAEIAYASSMAIEADLINAKIIAIRIPTLEILTWSNLCLDFSLIVP